MIAHAPTRTAPSAGQHRRGFLALLRRCRAEFEFDSAQCEALFRRVIARGGVRLDHADTLIQHLQWSPSTLARALRPTAATAPDHCTSRIWTIASGEPRVDNWLVLTRRCLRRGAPIEAIACAEQATSAAESPRAIAAAESWLLRAALTAGHPDAIEQARETAHNLPARVADLNTGVDAEIMHTLHLESLITCREHDPWSLIQETHQRLEALDALERASTTNATCTSTDLNTERAGWWTLSAARVAWRVLPRDPSSDRMLGVLTAKLEQLAMQVPGSPLRRELDLLDRTIADEEADHA